MTMRRALVTGGNRGIGLQTCRNLGAGGMSVLLGSRNVALGDEAAAGLRTDGLAVTAIELDVADPASITRLAERLERDGVHVDVLVNNAGVIATGDLLAGSGDQMTEALDVNLLGPWRMAKAFMPAMAARGWGRVVNVSSAWGSFATGLEGPAAYAITKAALNALTVRLGREAGAGVKVNAACPGWVRTRMGGESAPRSVIEGADTVVWLATLPDDGPTGGFFRDRKPAEW